MTHLQVLLDAMRVVPAGALDIEAILVAGRRLRRRRAARVGVVVALTLVAVLVVAVLWDASTPAARAEPTYQDHGDGVYR
jgi:hypothetical protein